MRYENLAFCPYCVDHGDRTITCEGLVADGTMIQIFATPRKKRRWYDEVCCRERCGRRCPAAAALDALADEGTDIPLKMRLMDRGSRELLKEAARKAEAARALRGRLR